MNFEMKSNIVTYNQLVKELDDIYKLYSKKSGLSDTVFWILYFIYERKEPYTQTEICDAWYYSRQTVDSALKNLEEKNLVKLIPSKTNRKNKEIFLTEEGLLLARKVIVPLMEAETKALDALGEKEMHLFFSLMKKHTDIFKEEINHILKEEEE